MAEHVRLADVQDAAAGTLHQVDARSQRQLAQDGAQVRLPIPVPGHGWLGERLGKGVGSGLASSVRR